ncbi:hypothetical protein BH24DEI2_BH24DEI2_24530 [soil metagenome]
MLTRATLQAFLETRREEDGYPAPPPRKHQERRLHQTFKELLENPSGQVGPPLPGELVTLLD